MLTQDKSHTLHKCAHTYHTKQYLVLSNVPVDRSVYLNITSHQVQTCECECNLHPDQSHDIYNTNYLQSTSGPCLTYGQQ